MPAGRPTIYEERFCDLLIEHMAKGLSYESFAGFLGVSKQTIYDWEKVNAEFLDSKKIGVEKSRLFWEQQGIDGLFDTKESTKEEDGSWNSKERKLNGAVWIFNMKNRFKEEWRDKQEIETTPSTLTVTISGPTPPSE
jgi:DNA-binding XRE family transcriptional regulator